MVIRDLISSISYVFTSSWGDFDIVFIDFTYTHPHTLYIHAHAYFTQMHKPISIYPMHLCISLREWLILKSYLQYSSLLHVSTCFTLYLILIVSLEFFK